MSSNSIINLSNLDKPDYIGSVQELYHVKENPEWMVCKTMPGGSVFDVGTIFSIPGSDICRTALRHKIYTLLGSPAEWESISAEIKDIYKNDPGFVNFLSEGELENYKLNGANTHHLGMVDQNTGEIFQNSFPPNPSQYVLVKRFKIIKPARLSYFSNHLWDYSGYYHADKYVIPLENIVRFGATSGSSIYRKYLKMNNEQKKAYLSELGLGEELSPWQIFNTPIVDFTTKYEPEDRNLSPQEALYISGNEGGKLLKIIKMSILGSILVSRFFRKIGLFLWDLKWEIAKDGENLFFVDTIDTDSVRVTSKITYQNKIYFINFNKQSMRDYYKIMHPEWYKAVNAAKLSANKSGEPFHEHLKEGQEKGYYPNTPEVDPEFISIQEGKFSTLAKYIYEQATVDDTVEDLLMIGKKELKYYEANNTLSEFAEINGINPGY